MNLPEHLLGLKQLDASQLRTILDRAMHYRTLLDKGSELNSTHKGKSVINLFFENSTRTRVSFEKAEKMLGMNSVNFTNEGSSFSKGESFLDTVRNLNSMRFDYYVVRHSAPGVPKLVSEHTDGIVISAGDGASEHPTQGLLDIMTIMMRVGDPDGLKVCIAGDISHSRVAMSNIFGLQKLGAIVSVCGPRSFIPNSIEALGVKIYYEMDNAVRENDVINILRVQLERDAGRLLPGLQEYSRFYGMNRDRFALNPKLKILHPGPMNMNVEIDNDVVASPNSLIFDQVTNGLAVRLAVFDLFKRNTEKS